MSTFIQFDGEIDDIEKLMQELKASSVRVLAIHRSRWKSEDGQDKGGRIDVEIEDEVEPVKVKVVHLEQVMKNNKTWKKK